MKILGARPTRHCAYLFVRCRCRRRFGHRADRSLIVCYHCGRIAERGVRSLLPRTPRVTARSLPAFALTRVRPDVPRRPGPPVDLQRGDGTVQVALPC